MVRFWRDGLRVREDMFAHLRARCDMPQRTAHLSVVMVSRAVEALDEAKRELQLERAIS